MLDAFFMTQQRLNMMTILIYLYFEMNLHILVTPSIDEKS